MTDTSQKPAMCDPAEVRRAISLFLPQDRVTEIRALDCTVAGDRFQQTYSGYFDSIDAAVEAVQNIASAKGVYFVPNELNPALLARSVNKFRPVKKEPTTSDHDIIRRCFLPIDCDPVRPAGIASDDMEHGRAISKVYEIDEWLQSQGWPAGIVADSGNGGHLVHSIDLPADDNGLVERCLKSLASMFNDAAVTVDLTTFNPARIWKLYGTIAAKGDNSPQIGRPHRMSKLLQVPDTIGTVSRELLEALAGPTTQAVHSNGKAHNGQKFDLESWIRQHGLAVNGPDAWKGGRKWIFTVCPWNPDHTNGSAFIAQHPTGEICAGCHHNGCNGKGWPELRDLFEPGRRDKYRSNGTPPSATSNVSKQVTSDNAMDAGLVLTRMDGVQRIPVEWLWQYRLAMKKLNLFYGDPDVGKSTLATYLISQVSRGGEWPDGAGNAPLGTSFVMTFEDGIADTFGPRLDAAGADSSKVIALSMIRFLDENGKLSERAFTMDMVKHLSDAVDKFPDRKLVVIDPPSSCMPEGVNENSNSGVRGILTPWARFAEEKGVCVLFITHRPKAGTAKAVHGALGSLAWLAAVRSAFMLAKDKDDPQRRLFLRAKCNLAPPVPNLAYRIAGPVAHIEWLGAVETTADDVSRGDADPGRPGPDPKKLEAATDWLSAELADFQEHKVTDLKDSAKAAGVSWRTVQRASTKMGVKVHRASFGAGYVWRIPKP